MMAGKGREFETADGSQTKSKSDIEEGTAFSPHFDSAGLIPAIVTGGDGTVLMFAYMNAEALRLTLEKREAHFWSRSRQALWRKGETSGNTLQVEDIRVDCDQDVIWIKAALAGDAACHTGRHSCFYRRILLDGTGAAHLDFVENRDRA